MRPGSKKWKLFMAKLYGFGAAVVIVGALFKIQHWTGASEMLIVGLGTEAIIFIFSAFEPIHEDPDWTLVYPELAMGHSDVDHSGSKGMLDDDESVTEKLDKMLAEAKIEPELLENLGNGLQNLSSQANRLSEMSDASVATDDYVNNLRNASSQVGELSDSYKKASDAITGITENADAGQMFGEQVTKVSANLAALNNVYELQLKGASSHLEVQENLYQGIDEMMGNLHASLEDTRKYKENISELSGNLTVLNTVYGNMLSAMNMKPSQQG